MTILSIQFKTKQVTLRMVGANYTGLGYLELSANVPLTTAQYFRAEFIQYGSGSSVFGDAQGPRIMEINYLP